MLVEILLFLKICLLVLDGILPDEGKLNSNFEIRFNRTKENIETEIIMFTFS